MANDPLSKVSTRQTPQSEQADPRQVPNSAGGYGFQVTADARLHRFLTLGTEGGTYYASEQALTRENAQVVLDWAKNRPVDLVNAVVAVSEAGRAPRNNPALFALAVAAGLADDAGRKAALEALPRVARTATHLYTFVGYAEQFRGWGRGMRRAVGNWYLGQAALDAAAQEATAQALRDEAGRQRTAEMIAAAQEIAAKKVVANQLAYQVIKYRQRNGWEHRDLLRLAHPVGHPERHGPVFDFAAGRDGTTASKKYSGVTPAPLPPLIEAFREALAIDREKAADPKRKSAAYVRLIRDCPSLPWEALPDSALSQPDVWAELIAAGLPQTALMRQLPRMTRLGVLTQLGFAAQVVADQLADPQRLLKARVHPVSVLLAAKTYASGRSVRGDSSWSPVPKITDALDAAFYAAYGAVEPAGKRTMVALDVSGSMGSAIGGLPLTCREASVALALVTASTEPHTLITGFTAGSGRSQWGPRYGTAITPLNISPRQRLDDAVRVVSNLPFGGTDCALPMLWAAQQNAAVDTFLVVTDNETWAGNVHPHQALEAYRQKTGIPARLAVAAMTATDFTIADPADPGSMDVSGFDSAVPALLADFSAGRV